MPAMKTPAKTVSNNGDNNSAKRTRAVSEMIDTPFCKVRTPKTPKTPKTPRTSRPPTKAEISGNGRVVGRSLIKWNRPRMMEKLTLHLVYELTRQKIGIPWERIAHRLHPGSSGPSVQQYLGRLRRELIAKGHVVPPQAAKLGRKAESTEIRGYVRADLNGTDKTTVRPVSYDEDVEDPKFSLPDSFTEYDGFGATEYMIMDEPVDEVQSPAAQSTPSPCAGRDVHGLPGNWVDGASVRETHENPMGSAPAEEQNHHNNYQGGGQVNNYCGNFANKQMIDQAIKLAGWSSNHQTVEQARINGQAVEQVKLEDQSIKDFDQQYNNVDGGSSLVPINKATEDRSKQHHLDANLNAPANMGMSTFFQGNESLPSMNSQTMGAHDHRLLNQTFAEALNQAIPQALGQAMSYYYSQPNLGSMNAHFATTGIPAMISANEPVAISDDHTAPLTGSHPAAISGRMLKSLGSAEGNLRELADSLGLNKDPTTPQKNRFSGTPVGTPTIETPSTGSELTGERFS